MLIQTTLFTIFLLASSVFSQTPTGTEQHKFYSLSGSTNDNFGASVDVFSDFIMIVGSPGNSFGAAAIYVWPYKGPGGEEAQLFPSSGYSSTAKFGCSVSTSNGTAIVGAYGNFGADDRSGSAHIFLFDGPVVYSDTTLFPKDGENGDNFGVSVSISDNTVAIVGADGDDDNGTSSGSAYIFRFDGKDWIEEAKLLASDGGNYDEFGSNVAIEGDVVVVGADGYSSGSAYIFRFDGTAWSEEAHLVASDGVYGDEFGNSVSISGNTVIIGAQGSDTNGESSGAAYVFTFDGNKWAEEAKLLASDGERLDYFGTSVSISGNTAVVGAEGDDDNGYLTGSAYIYNFDGNSWVEATKLLASDGWYDDNFGNSVAIDGDSVVVGAYHDDDLYIDAGSVYYFGSDDCNGNGIADYLDVANGASYDCDQNGVPDECQHDCDGDGFINPCDNDPDCDNNGIPDNCEADCNENGIGDVCDIIFGISEDVNEDGIPDECQDCNGNGILDPEDIANGTSEDLDWDGIPDECQTSDTWTVDDDGPADFDNIADAVAMAGYFDEILVYPGTYSLTKTINPVGKEIWLHSSDGPDVTIIDGADTYTGIECITGETNNTRIEGFTITNCNQASWPGGGGMTCRFSSPTLINCIFASNYAVIGGGMSLENSSPSIIDCVFENNNTEGNGAGIWCSDNSFPTISGCQFLNNIVSSDSYPGGGIIIVEGSNAFISDTLFCGNFPNQISGSWTDLGGTCISVTCDDSDGDGWPDQCGTIDDGVHHVPDEYPTIQQAINAAGDHDEIIVAPGTYSECEDTISYFTAIMNPLGKRLWIHSSGGADVTIIDANKCHGGVFTSGETTDLVIEGFTFTSTTTDFAPSRMFLSAATFRDCLFTGGSTNGAAYCRRGVPEFEGCIFTNNAVAVTLSDWQGYGEDYGTAKFTNCIFRNNTDGGSSEGVAISMTDGMDLEVSNCLFEYNSGSAIIYTGSEYTDSVITDCVFRNNDASGGQFGGIIFETHRSGNLNMQGCLFENNTATYQLLSYPEMFEDFAHLISDSEFKNNSGSGIGSFLLSTTLIIEDCLIKENALGGIENSVFCTDMTLIDTVVCSNGEFQINCEDWIDGGGNTIAEVCFDDCQAADITDDGIVDISDILAILGYWGSSIPAGDVDGNGVVDIGDLLMVVGNWGPCE